MFINLPEEEESKLVNGWWYNFKQKSKEWNKSKVHFSARLCIVCNRVWQFIYSKSVGIEYLNDFPTLGLVRRPCKYCEADNE